MPNRHKNPMLGWNPPAELSAWARAEAKRRGVDLSTILTEALASYRADHDPPQEARITLPPGGTARTIRPTT